MPKRKRSSILKSIQNSPGYVDQALPPKRRSQESIPDYSPPKVLRKKPEKKKKEYVYKGTNGFYVQFEGAEADVFDGFLFYLKENENGKLTSFDPVKGEATAYLKNLQGTDIPLNTSNIEVGMIVQVWWPYMPESVDNDEEAKTGKWRKAKISFHENLNEKTDRTFSRASTQPLIQLLGTGFPENSIKILEAVIAQEEKSYHGNTERIKKEYDRVRAIHPRPSAEENRKTFKESKEKRNQLSRNSVFCFE